MTTIRSILTTDHRNNVLWTVDIVIISMSSLKTESYWFLLVKKVKRAWFKHCTVLLIFLPFISHTILLCRHQQCIVLLIFLYVWCNSKCLFPILYACKAYINSSLLLGGFCQMWPCLGSKHHSLQQKLHFPVQIQLQLDNWFTSGLCTMVGSNVVFTKQYNIREEGILSIRRAKNLSLEWQIIHILVPICLLTLLTTLYMRKKLFTHVFKCIQMNSQSITLLFF